MAKRRSDRARDPVAARSTATLRQRGNESTAHPMVDGGDDLAARLVAHRPPEAVVVTHAGAPRFRWRYRDAATLTLGLDDVPAALSWSPLAGLLVDAVVTGLLVRAARSLITVLLGAGADTVRVLEVEDGELMCVETHAGWVR